MSWLSEISGIHISPQHGFHVDPGTILNNIEAVGGNPMAIAASVGNAVHAVSPNSSLGKLGQTTKNVGGTLASLGGSPSGIINNLKGALGMGGASGTPGGSTDDGYGGVAGDSASTMAADDAMGGVSGVPGKIYNAVNGVLSIPAGDDSSPTASTAGSSNGGTSGGMLNNIMGLLTNGQGGLSNPVMLGLAGAEGVMGANAYSKMGNLQDKALASVQNAYNERAPLRTAGLAMMQNTLNHPVNASATFNDPGNPYNRPPIPLPSAQTPAVPAPTPVPAAA